MGFLKRLFGLGSRSDSQRTADWAAGLLGPPSLPATVAAEWPRVTLSQLPAPPRGFTWQPFNASHLTVLRPQEWHIHEEISNDVFTGVVSTQRIETDGKVQTGLTLKVFRQTKDNLRRALPNCHPDTAIAGVLGGLLPNLPFDPRFEVLYMDPCVQRTASSRVLRLHCRRLEPGNSTIIYYFLIEFDESPDVYVLTFESPESAWDDRWKIGKQILTNVVFSAKSSTGVIFSMDPPPAPDDLLRAEALDLARSLGWSLAHEDRAKGLLVWRMELAIPGKPQATQAATCTWCMKRVNNEIQLYDPIDLVSLTDSSGTFLEAISTVARGTQEGFKRRWLARVGPVTLRPPTPEMVDLCVKTAVQVGCR